MGSLGSRRPPGNPGPATVNHKTNIHDQNISIKTSFQQNAILLIFDLNKYAFQ